MERENRTLEYKADLTKTYLKTVSAHANYGTGKIKFGITDDGKCIGVDNPVETVLALENQINDNIIPNPSFQFSIGMDNVITLEVQRGHNTPYCYHNKAYKRNDSSTTEVDSIEFKNLVLRGTNQTFTEIPWTNPNPDQDLTFQSFEKHFRDRFGIDPEYPQTMITLEVYSKEEGYTNCGAMLSDQCPFPGIDIVIYNDSHRLIKNRIRLEKMSVLEMIDRTMDLFPQQYFYEAVRGIQRETVELIPLLAFREVLINAIVYREWQINSSIRIEMDPHSVTVLSPGGLPDGITEADYLSNQHLSILRNKTLALVFLKLGYIENLGSGIPFVLDQYRQSVKKPEFIVKENSIGITLPALQQQPDLSGDEMKLYQLIKMYQPVSSTELLNVSGLSRSKQLALLNTLTEKKHIEKTGNGRSTKYHIPS